MAVEALILVSVRTRDEVSRAELGDDDVVRYAGPEDGEAIEAVVRQKMRDERLTETESFRALKRTGWSNGYLMVKLD